MTVKPRRNQFGFYPKAWQIACRLSRGKQSEIKMSRKRGSVLRPAGCMQSVRCRFGPPKEALCYVRSCRYPLRNSNFSTNAPSLITTYLVFLCFFGARDHIGNMVGCYIEGGSHLGYKLNLSLSHVAILGLSIFILFFSFKTKPTKFLEPASS